MSVEWRDLSEDEKSALKQILLAPYLKLPATMVRRLKELGLVEQKLGGTSLTKPGHRILSNVAAERLRSH